eukprot:366557-Chlamydomonas_euryale.AAC.5
MLPLHFACAVAGPGCMGGSLAWAGPSLGLLGLHGHGPADLVPAPVLAAPWQPAWSTTRTHKFNFPTDGCRTRILRGNASRAVQTPEPSPTQKLLCSGVASLHNVPPHSPAGVRGLTPSNL